MGPRHPDRDAHSLRDGPIRGKRGFPPPFEVHQLKNEQSLAAIERWTEARVAFEEQTRHWQLPLHE